MSVAPLLLLPSSLRARASARRAAPAAPAASAALSALALVLVLALTLVFGFVLAACNSGPAEAPESYDPNAPQITAQGEKFDKTELEVPADQGFEIVLFNKDSTSHNVSIYADEGHNQRIFGGALAGNGTKVYHVQALAPGTYYFQCDVHPAMKGIVVAGASAS